jgi:nicotinate phosphoribosyltransferase
LKPFERETAEGILFTDQYQLTMAQLYYRVGLHERQVQFDHFFRSYPDYGGHQAGYCISAGLQSLIDWLETSRFREADLDFLRSQAGRTGRRVLMKISWIGCAKMVISLKLTYAPFQKAALSTLMCP